MRVKLADRSGPSGLRQRAAPTFRSVAVSLEVSEMLISFLMGHVLEGVSAKYTDELMIANSAALPEAQERISKRIVSLLWLTLGGHHDAPLAPDVPTEKSKAAGPD